MKYIAVLLLLPSVCFGLTPEQRSAQSAAKINASYAVKSSKAAKTIVCQARSQSAAAEVNKKVWILNDDSVVMQAPKTTAWNTRAPVGHTHTCKNGHTWDHQLSASHNCPYCGAFQNVQDRSPRPVTIKVQTAVQATPAPVVETYTMPTSIRTIQAGGCENGQCANPAMRRFFR